MMELKDKLEPPAQLVLKVSKEFKDKTAPLDRTVLLVPLENRVLKVSKEIKEFKVQLVLLV